jgi:hypothetical protein
VFGTGSRRNSALTGRQIGIKFVTAVLEYLYFVIFSKPRASWSGLAPPVLGEHEPGLLSLVTDHSFIFTYCDQHYDHHEYDAL